MSLTSGRGLFWVCDVIGSGLIQADGRREEGHLEICNQMHSAEEHIAFVCWESFIY